MKYYKLEMERRFPEQDQVLGHANGQYVPNGKMYFDKIGKREILLNTPIFDHFHLQSYGPENEWEWRLQDVHGGIGVYPRGGYWYISNDFKLLLENFSIAPSYHFYETRLLYKGKKLVYWIFQFPINPLENYNYKKSEYYLDGERVTGLKNADEYDAYDDDIWKKTKKKIEWKKLVLQDTYDFSIGIDGSKIVSENLKDAIEKMQLKGFIFSALAYEVVAPASEAIK
ncbi:hypothetical protein [Cellulophaga tyrosinoxydans]|nr:hypothetical protein [Cellulophaga tyrosinoxydans]